VVGLKTIALTDHDTVAGIERALGGGGTVQSRGYSGIEFTTENPRSEVISWVIYGPAQCRPGRGFGQDPAGTDRQDLRDRQKLKALGLEIEPEEFLLSPARVRRGGRMWRGR